MLKLFVLILAFSAAWQLHSAFAFCIFGGFLPYVRCNDTDICDAVDTRERSAAFVIFQRIQPSFPLHKNVDSAALAELPACHFSGYYAKCAIDMMR